MKPPFSAAINAWRVRRSLDLDGRERLDKLRIRLDHMAERPYFIERTPLALALVLPAWASALIIGVVLLIIAGIIAAVGVRALKRGMPPTPTDTLESVQEDVRAVRGLRK